MDYDVDSARADLMAIRHGFRTDRQYANEMWRRRAKEKPQVTKSKWAWPIKRLVDLQVEKKQAEERKNVILFERKFEKFVERVNRGEFKKIAKRK